MRHPSGVHALPSLLLAVHASFLLSSAFRYVDVVLPYTPIELYGPCAFDEAQAYTRNIMNRTTSVILSILAVIILVTVAVYMFEQSEQTPVSEEVSLNTYQNTDHGYTLTYPGTLDILEYTPDMATIGTRTEGGIDGIADVRVAIIQGNPGETFMAAASRSLATLCDADGPESSFTCTGLDRGMPFLTSKGAPGFEVYLKGALRTLSTGAVETVQKGPYYVFLMQGDAGASKVLVVHAPLNQTALEADADAIRAIAKSVTFVEVPQELANIGQYITENISSLSPEPEVLGGTYYVTDIQTENGTGVVSYEDGHNAYTADFTYSVSAEGALSVDSFVIRPI